MDDSAKRKERGRLAQRAYRQRQVDAIASLSDRNRTMQEAIETLTRIASTRCHSDDAELSQAIQAARLAAGLAEPKTEHTSSVSSAASASPETEQQHASSALVRSETTATPQLLAHSHGRVSPKLGYGLWLEPETIRVVYPPADIVSYLRTEKTLSVTIYWASMSYGLQILQGALIHGNPEAIAKSWEVFGSIPPLHPERAVLDGIHARLSFRRSGTIERDHPGHRDPDAGLKMRARMAATCEAAGISLDDDYVTPMNFEELLRVRLGDRFKSIDQGLRGMGGPHTQATVRNLVATTVQRSVCLGDGPRWRMDVAVDLFEKWMKAFNEHTQGPAPANHHSHYTSIRAA